MLPNVASLLAAIPLIGWYNLRVTGHVTGLAYMEHMRQYDPVPVFWPLAPLPSKQYSNANLRAAHQTEIDDYRRFHDASLPLALTLQVVNISMNGVWLQFLAFGFLLLVVPWARVWKRKKWLVVLLAAGLAALLPEVWMRGHYTGALHHRRAHSDCRRGASAVVSHRRFAGTRAGVRFPTDCPAGSFGDQLRGRAWFKSLRRASSGVCRLLGKLGSVHEWVYNGADLDASPVIFAHLRSPRENRDLLNHFPDRKTWLVRLGPQLTDIRLERYEPSLPGAF
jgi:hypothetical protein